MVTQQDNHVDLMNLNEQYSRERLNPQPGDSFYLHLADILLAIKQISKTEYLQVLDYGAGISPYRSLFLNCDYKRADIVSNADLDYIISEKGEIFEESEKFDLILSTQVIEHIYYTDKYFTECFRLLKSGGKMIVTTHGLFEDHGCPDDFRRWTAQGLQRDLERAGFKIITMQKLTTGPRAILFFIDRYLDTMIESRKTIPGLLNWILRTLASPFRGWLHRQSDKYFNSHRIVGYDVPNNSIYIALCAYVFRK